MTILVVLVMTELSLGMAYGVVLPRLDWMVISVARGVCENLAYNTRGYIGSCISQN